MNPEVQEIVDEIKRNRTFLITTHLNPEGDGIGSELLLAMILKRLGKNVSIYNFDPAPKNLKFLPGADLIIQKEKVDEPFGIIFVLDSGDLSRTGFLTKEHLRKYKVISIDHHITSKPFGHINWIDKKASATAEMIYRLSEVLGVELDTDMALCLYASLCTETGSFRFSNTTPDVHNIVAKLIKMGINPWSVVLKVESVSFERLNLLGHLLLSIERSRDGRLAWMIVTEDLFRKTKTTVEDIEDFVNFPRLMEGVEVALLIREVSPLVPQEPKVCKISFRSNGQFNVAQFAERYGGGGHRNAAGCTIEGTIEEVKKNIIKELEERL